MAHGITTLSTLTLRITSTLHNDISIMTFIMKLTIATRNIMTLIITILNIATLVINH